VGSPFEKVTGWVVDIYHTDRISVLEAIDRSGDVEMLSGEDPSTTESVGRAR
jgi:hypothetical protein